MSYPINYPTPVNCNVQTFYAGLGNQTWIKPQGASFVWFTLIGRGGNGNATNSGGSGAVTNCLVPAFLIPDSLQIRVGVTTANTTVEYITAGTNYTLLTANSGAALNGGAASTATSFAAAGFYQSIAGQNGVSGGASSSASATTFLSGGAGGGSYTANYGYSTGNNRDGFFQTQPIIVGLGSVGSGSDSLRAGIGCGGATGIASGNAGGNGLVVIISW